MSRSDSSLLIQTNSLRTTILAVYVDDIIITGSETSYISTLITELSAQFAIKNFGNLNHFLGIEVLKTRMIVDCFSHSKNMRWISSRELLC